MADEMNMSLATSSNQEITINDINNNDDNVQRIENPANSVLSQIENTNIKNNSNFLNNDDNIIILTQTDQNQNTLITQDKKLKRKKKVKIVNTTTTNNNQTNSTSINVDDKLNKKNKNKVENQNMSINTNCDTEKLKTELSNLKETLPVETSDSELKSTITLSTTIVSSKPPLPPSKIPIKPSNTELQSTKIPPPRLKRKLDEQNSSLVQKLNACTEQLRLEITNLKSALGNERNAVRMLRAQYEAETRKSKMEIKKLQAALETSKKVAIANQSVTMNNKKFRDDSNLVKDPGGDNTKLSNEISALREANRILEEKIQKINEAERRKTADIRELKDSYEIRLTQISKSAKTEISRLLEEIKTKERNIGQLKKEINCLKNPLTNKKDIKRNAQHPSEMKKLKDIERINSSNISNAKCIPTTCGGNDFHETPHEINERILEPHVDLHIYQNKDAINSSDTDSALSSAPQSISPQPPANGIENSSDIWQSVKNYSKEIDTLQKNNELLRKQNDTLKKELDAAKQQIFELEKTVKEANKTNKMQQLIERIKYLEDKKDTLMKETHELREQNELLEFRILELEESHEKWSLRSNSNPDTRDMWTDTDRKSDDILMYASDHTDSGVTSPHSQHHIDDRNVISPCDLSLMDHASNDEIKRRLTDITKRPYIGDDDRLCLLQVLTLINNLESLSEDSILVNDEMISLDLTKSKASDYGSESSSPRSLSTSAIDIQQPLQKIPKTINNNNNHSRIIATVLPYSSTLSTPTDSPSRKLRSWNSSNLQESGVFVESDLTLDGNCTQSTQTEPEDFIPCGNGKTPTADLCAEIQKLNKFREKIEECATKSAVAVTSKVPQSTTTTATTILSPNLSDQRRLQYYKERLELLENKLLIYESSGDLQTKRLAERLQREIKLESLVKELQQKVNCLEVDNLRLEEEKCEFEEAENDTRLRLQRLEIDLEILNQRNTELEMSKEAVQGKLKEARNQCTLLQETMKNEQEKVEKLEEDSKDLKNRLNLIKTSMPAILLFNTLMVNTPNKKLSNDNDNSALIATSNKCLCNTEYPVKDYYLENKVQELLTREKELTQSIKELNRAYHETLENADNLWVQIEKEYKDRLVVAESTENQLKAKITQLEENLTYNSQCAQERITQLEDSEKDLQHRITKLIKEKKDLLFEHENVLKECQTMKDELTKMKNFITGPIQENLDKEKQRVRSLEEDLAISNNLLSEMEKTYRSELHSFKTQLYQASKELLHIEVTNSELKEEVTTLEKEIIDLQKQRSIDEEKIRNLTDELRTKEEMLIQIKSSNRSRSHSGQSLAQELEPNNSINCTMQTYSSTDDCRMMSGLNSVQMKLKEALDKAEKRTTCTSQCENLMKIEKEVQNLAGIYTKKLNNTPTPAIKNELAQTEKVLLQNQSTSPRLPSVTDSDNSIDEYKTISNSNISIEKKYKSRRRNFYESKSDTLINKRTYEEKCLKSNFNKEPLSSDRKYDQQNQLFPKKNVEAQNYQDIGKIHSLHPEFLKDSNKKDKIYSTPSIFSQFRSAVTHLKSKLFIEPELKKQTKHPDVVCNNCLNKLLISEKNHNSKHDKVYHLHRKPKNYIRNSSTITINCRNELPLENFSATELFFPPNYEQHNNLANTSNNSKNSIQSSKKYVYQENTYNSVTDMKKFIPSLHETDNIIQNYSINLPINNEPINFKKSTNNKNISNIEFFISLIREDLRIGCDCLLNKEIRLKDLYETNLAFKRDLDLTVQLGCLQSYYNKKYRKIKNCEDIVRVMACLKKIKVIYEPYKIMILKKIKEEITEKLIIYYCNSRDPKLYCPIYTEIQHQNDIF